MRSALPVLLVILASLLACQAPIEPEGARLGAIVGHLSSPALQGRLLGSPGGALARQFLLTTADEAGLLPCEGGAERPFEVAIHELSSRRVAVEGPGGYEGEAVLAARGPFTADPGALRLWTDPDSTPAAAGGLLVHRYLPGRGGSPIEMRYRAAEAGASGLLLLPHPEDRSGMFNRYKGRSASGDLLLHGLLGDAPEIPLLYGDAAMAEAIFDGEGLRGTDPWRWSFPEVAERQVEGRNLVFDLPGGGEGPLLLLVAHYDHLGPAEAGYYPGADDNASGLSVLLELARTLEGEQLPYRLRFLFSDGEEEGWLGAQAYLRDEELPDRVINLDTVGRGGVDHYRKLREPGGADPRLLIVWSGEAGRVHEGLLASGAARSFHSQTGEGSVFALAGDHHPFHRAGLPAHFIFGGFNPDYHDTGDTADKVLTGRLVDLCGAMGDFLRATGPDLIAPAKP